MSSSSSSAGSTPEPGPGASAPSALRNDGERFRLLVENSHDIIVEISGVHEVLYVSPNVAAVIGYAAEELLGANLFERVHPDDLADVWTQFERKSGRATCRYKHKDGSWRWLETTGREFATPTGAVHRVLVARDITAQMLASAERERLEAELLQAEKLSALGTLAGGMAHDFNNLLTAILAYAELARAHALGADLQDALEQITRAADRARNIAQHVLEFSTQQRRVRVPVNVAAIAREVLSLLRITIPVSVEVVPDLNDENCTVLANPSQLHQVVINLCQNAVHAMRDRRGRLQVRVTREEFGPNPAGRPPGLRRGAYACLAVIDNGHGMTASTLSRIFEPFFTTKVFGEGTGLGLAVVQSIVREHFGVVNVTSQPGEGTVFRIYFPLHRDSPVPPA